MADTSSETSDIDAGFQCRIVLTHQVSQFLYSEAELLDNHDYDAWLSLLSDELVYRMPTRVNVGRRAKTDMSGPDELAHFDESRRSLERRVARLNLPQSWAEQPPTRTRRIIGNIRVGESVGQQLPVTSNFICYANRFETETAIWAGERRDLLLGSGDQWRIAERTIVLDQSVILANSISIFF